MSDAPEPWRARLELGDADEAWRLFLERYRGLLLATVCRLVPQEEDRAEAFACLCEELSAQQLARLRRYRADAPRPARFSTWLVTVAHHQLIDWRRRRNGRPRVRPPTNLSPLQQQIFTRVFTEGRAHAEAYELLRASGSATLTFGTFLRELAETYRLAELSRPRGIMHYLAPRPEPAADESAGFPAEQRLATADLRGRLGSALAALSAEERIALRLYVIERLPAADVARVLGWAGAKTVYNRVYRALMQLRTHLDDQGLRPTDF